MIPHVSPLDGTDGASADGLIEKGVIPREPPYARQFRHLIEDLREADTRGDTNRVRELERQRDDLFASLDADQQEAVVIGATRATESRVIQDIQGKWNTNLKRAANWVPRTAEYVSTAGFGAIAGTLIGVRRAYRFFMAGAKA